MFAHSHPPNRNKITFPDISLFDVLCLTIPAGVVTVKTLGFYIYCMYKNLTHIRRRPTLSFYRSPLWCTSLISWLSSLPQHEFIADSWIPFFQNYTSTALEARCFLTRKSYQVKLGSEIWTNPRPYYTPACTLYVHSYLLPLMSKSSPASFTILLSLIAAPSYAFLSPLTPMGFFSSIRSFQKYSNSTAQNIDFSSSAGLNKTMPLPSQRSSTPFQVPSDFNKVWALTWSSLCDCTLLSLRPVTSRQYNVTGIFTTRAGPFLVTKDQLIFISSPRLRKVFPALGLSFGPLTTT